MITLGEEQLIPLRDAPRHLPPRPNGKRVHISACYRWISSGVAGVVLESIRVGGTTYTSLEALQRFGERLSGQQDPATLAVRSARRVRAARLLEIQLGLQADSIRR